jgi:hypothetical protein
VPPPELKEAFKPPAFVSPSGWLDDICNKVKVQFDLEDSENPRVSPVALVRCSRGGKTRALHELASALSRKNDAGAIIYVSFNGQTNLLPWEKLEPPLEALCRRILFTALVGDNHVKVFGSFAENTTIRANDVVEWLGEEKCTLIIDELNLVDMDLNFACFLKDNFLVKGGRALVFSSHVISINNLLTSFMHSPSERAVVTVKLPLAQNLYQAKKALELHSLTAHEALFLGLIPALFYCSKHSCLPHQRRSDAIEQYLDSGITVDNVAQLLLTMLKGDQAHVPKVLLELMDIDIEMVHGVEKPVARWIPYHMIAVLTRLSESVSLPASMRRCLHAICEQFW